MKGSEITDLVIVKLEEKSSFLTKGTDNNPIISAGDNLDELKPVYSYIDAHLCEAADEMLMLAPLNRLVPVDGRLQYDCWYGTRENTHITWESGEDAHKTWIIRPYFRSSTVEKEGIGEIILPVDFLRLYSFRMEQWDRPVHKAITKSDHLYTLQHNRFTRGTPQKPVVVYSGERVLFDKLDNLGLSYDIYDKKIFVMFEESSRHFDDEQLDAPDLLIDEGLLLDGERCLVVEDNGYTHLCVRNGSNISVERIQNLPTLTYYSVIPDSRTEAYKTVDEFLYIPRFRKSLDYNREVAEMIALNCAKKVLEVFGRTDDAAAMTNEIKYVLDSMKL